MMMQHTLKNSIHCTGIGLHSGAQVTMTLHPAPADTGIIVRRTDGAAAGTEIAALWHNVVDTRLCTVLGNDQGVVVGTVEHLMAALAGCAVDNVVIEIDGPEVPAMDGSAWPFVFLIECAGIEAQEQPRHAIRILRDVTVGDPTRSAALSPAFASSYAFEIDFASAAVAHQHGEMDLMDGNFTQDISRARTFGFLHEVDAMRSAGLARGGSLENAVVVDGDTVMNPDGLRYTDEFVRHKILDSIGDLYLAGAPIIGHFEGFRSGHMLNNQLLRVLLANANAWESGDYDDMAAPPVYSRQQQKRVAVG